MTGIRIDDEPTNERGCGLSRILRKGGSNSERDAVVAYLTGCGDGPGEGGGARRRPEEAGGGGSGGRAGRALGPARLARRRVVSRGPGGRLGLKDGGAGGEAHQSGGGRGGAQAPRPARRGAGMPWGRGSSGGARRLAPAEVSHYCSGESLKTRAVSQAARSHCP